MSTTINQNPECFIHGCRKRKHLLINSTYTRKDGTICFQHICREHKRERMRAYMHDYYQTPAGRRAVRRANRRYYYTHLVGVK